MSVLEIPVDHRLRDTIRGLMGLNQAPSKFYDTIMPSPRRDVSLLGARRLWQRPLPRSFSSGRSREEKAKSQQYLTLVLDLVEEDVVAKYLLELFHRGHQTRTKSTL